MDTAEFGKLARRWVSLAPVATMLLVAMSWTLPFLQPHHRYPLSAFVSEWIALSTGIAAFLSVLASMRRDGLQVPWIASAPLLLALLVSLHALSGRMPYSETGWIAVLYLVWAACLMVVGRWFATVSRLWSADWLAICLLSGSVLASIGGLLQMFEIHSVLDPVIVAKQGRPFGNLGQGNHFAQYLAMGLASLAYLAGRRRVGVLAGLVILIPLLVTFSATGSRANLLYLVAMLSVGGWWHWRTRSLESRLAFGWLALVVLGYALLAAAGLLAGSGRESGVAPPVAASLERMMGESGGGEVRWGFWRHALAIFLDNPFAGSGWGSFSWEMFLRNAGQWWLGPNHTANAHNLVAQLAAETGLVGLLLVLVPAGLWVRRVLAGSATSGTAWAFAVLALLGMSSMVEFPLWFAYFLGIGALLAGWLECKVVVIKASPFLASASVVVTLLAAWLLAGAWKDNRVLELALDGRALEQPGVAPMLVREMALMQHGSMLRPELEQVLAPTLLAGGLAVADSLEESRRVTRFAPIPANVFRHAALLQLVGRESEARELFQHALRAYAAVPNSHSAARDALDAGERVRRGSMAPLRNMLSLVTP